MAKPHGEALKYRVTVTLSDGTKGVHEVTLPDDVGVALAGMVSSQRSVNDDLDHGRSIQLSDPAVTYNSAYVLAIRFEVLGSDALRAELEAQQPVRMGFKPGD